MENKQIMEIDLSRALLIKDLLEDKGFARRNALEEELLLDIECFIESFGEL